MALQKKNIHGRIVFFDEKCLYGANYLTYDLSKKEASVFFYTARNLGSAQFEDDQDREYTLTKNRDGTYTLSRRQEDIGWF